MKGLEHVGTSSTAKNMKKCHSVKKKLIIVISCVAFVCTNRQGEPNELWMNYFYLMVD